MVTKRGIYCKVQRRRMFLVPSLQSASRDPQRSPMQWSDEVNAGFNSKSNNTWLPIHPDYQRVNVEVELPLYKHLKRTCSG